MLQPCNVLDDKGRNSAAHDVEPPTRQEDRQPASQQCEQNALHQQLPSDLPAAGSERGSQRDLSLSTGSASQLEVGNIGTGQKQNKNRCAHKHQDELPRTDSEIFDGIFDSDSVT